MIKKTEYEEILQNDLDADRVVQQMQLPFNVNKCKVLSLIQKDQEANYSMKHNQE